MSVSRLEIEAERAEAAEREALRMNGGAVARKPRPGLRFRTVGEVMREATAPNWLIRGVLEADTLAVLVGEPGAGKSFLALDWAACIATGRAWQGHRVKEPGPVLYLAGEGHAGIARRLLAWQFGHERRVEDAPLYISDRAVPLNLPEGEAALREAVAALGNIRPALLVVDTLARNFRGDENGAGDMSALVEALDAVRKPLGASALIVHHVGVGAGDRGRGSSALRGAADAEYLLTRTPEGAKLAGKKSKDAALLPPLGLRFEAVEVGLVDDEGEPVTSAILLPCDLPANQRAERAAEVAAMRQQGRSVRQIAADLGIPKSTVERLSREYLQARDGEVSHCPVP